MSLPKGMGRIGVGRLLRGLVHVVDSGNLAPPHCSPNHGYCSTLGILQCSGARFPPSQ